MDKPGSVIAQIVAEIERKTTTDKKADADMKKGSPAESISD